WNVVIRVGLKFDWHKVMTRHFAHGRHDAFVEGTLADRVAQRKRLGGDDREHVFTHGLKVFCSHWQPSRHTAVHPRTPSRATAPTGHPSRPLPRSMRTRFLRRNSVAHDALKASQVHSGQREAFKRAGKIVQSRQLSLKRDMPKSSWRSGSDRAVG